MGKERETYLANKVGTLFFVFCKGDGIFPDVIVCSLVGPAGVFELGDEAVLFLLLSEILVKGEGIVVLFWLAFSARAAFGLGSIGIGGRRGGIGCDGPSIGGGCRCTSPVSSRGGRIGAPLVGRLYSSIYRCGSLGLEFSVAVCAAPGLLDLLVRVARNGIRGRKERRGGRKTDVRPVWECLSKGRPLRVESPRLPRPLPRRSPRSPRVSLANGKNKLMWVKKKADRNLACWRPTL